MSFASDLNHYNLDLMYQSSIAYQFARFALGLHYQILPENVVHQAKRCLLDALGCAIGAYDAPGRSICETVIKELGGPEEATLFGSGLCTSALNATLVNSFLVRYLDYNDIGGGGHNSDAIPSILAVSEREKAGGRDFITSLVISYELGARVLESVSSRWLNKGWNKDSRVGLNMPPALGKLLGLNEKQIANAIGICTSHSFVLGILDTHREENTMTKNLRFGFGAYDAILSCLLARRGFTGPIRVVEGDSGIRETIFQDEMDLERIVDFSGWRILQTEYKSMPLNGGSIGHVSATLAIVKEHDLKPEDIEAVLLKTALRESLHTTSLTKKYPRNAETADHSAFYANAIAIKERAITPESFEPDKFADPIVLDLIEKIKVVYDPNLPTSGPQAISEITTKDGRLFRKRVDNPHGLGDDPLTDEELENKFSEMASKYMNKEQIKEIFDTVWNLEDLNDMTKLVKLMVFM